MARQFNGTSDFAVTAASLDLSGTNVLTVAFWLYWDAFANDDRFAMEHVHTDERGGVAPLRLPLRVGTVLGQRQSGVRGWFEPDAVSADEHRG